MTTTPRVALGRTPGQDPSVLAWRIALAPRPRFTTGGRHWWREMCWDAWHAATTAWEARQEAVALGYATEMAEFREQHPPPRFRDFLVQLSSGGQEPPW